MTKLKNTLIAISIILTLQNALAQNYYTPITKPPPTAVLNTPLAHGGLIRVRATLKTLSPGDFVSTLDVVAVATQLGASLELIADQTVIDQVKLSPTQATYSFAVNMTNGVQYQRLILRSIGTTKVTRITAQLGSADDDSGYDPAPLPPTPPPPGHGGHGGYPLPIPMPGPTPLPPGYGGHPSPVPPPPPPVNPGYGEYACETTSNGTPYYGYDYYTIVKACTDSMYSDNDECRRNVNDSCPGKPYDGSGVIVKPVVPTPINFPCYTTSINLPFFGYEYQTVVNACIADPKTDNDQCRNNVNTSCPGKPYDNGGVVVNPPPYNPPYNPGYPVHEKKYTCDSYYAKLLDESFQVIYDFERNSDCLVAIEQLKKNEPFCDSYYGKLVTPQSNVIYDFERNSDCLAAIPRVVRGKNFCDSYYARLVSSSGTTIYDFERQQDCENALD